MEVTGTGSTKTLGNIYQTLIQEENNLHFIQSSALKMEAAGSSENALNIYQTTRHHISKILFFFRAITILS
jgi:hypothetical protein